LKKFIILISLILLLQPACTNKIDSVTGATVQSSEVCLPLEKGDYEIIGVMPGLKNFVVKYDGKLYRGGELLSDEALGSLKMLGIKTIISITPTQFEREFAKKNGFTLVEIPFDKNTGPSQSDITLFTKTIKKEFYPFYVHCHGGTYRGGTFGKIYRTKILNWPSEKAEEEFIKLGGKSKH